MAKGLGMSQSAGGRVSCCSQSPSSRDLMTNCPHCGGGAAPFSLPVHRDSPAGPWGRREDPAGNNGWISDSLDHLLPSPHTSLLSLQSLISSQDPRIPSDLSFPFRKSRKVWASVWSLNWYQH